MGAIIDGGNQLLNDTIFSVKIKMRMQLMVDTIQDFVDIFHFQYTEQMSYRIAKKEFYTIEKIIDRRVSDEGSYQYLVKWKNYANKYNTWEPLAHLSSIISIVETFNADYERKLKVERVIKCRNCLACSECHKKSKSKSFHSNVISEPKIRTIKPFQTKMEQFLLMKEDTQLKNVNWNCFANRNQSEIQQNKTKKIENQNQNLLQPLQKIDEQQLVYWYNDNENSIIDCDNLSNILDNNHNHNDLLFPANYNISQNPNIILDQKQEQQEYISIEDSHINLLDYHNDIIINYNQVGVQFNAQDLNFDDEVIIKQQESQYIEDSKNQAYFLVNRRIEEPELLVDQICCGDQVKIEEKNEDGNILMNNSRINQLNSEVAAPKQLLFRSEKIKISITEFHSRFILNSKFSEDYNNIKTINREPQGQQKEKQKMSEQSSDKPTQFTRGYPSVIGLSMKPKEQKDESHHVEYSNSLLSRHEDLQIQPEISSKIEEIEQNIRERSRNKRTSKMLRELKQSKFYRQNLGKRSAKNKLQLKLNQQIYEVKRPTIKIDQIPPPVSIEQQLQDYDPHRLCEIVYECDMALINQKNKTEDHNTAHRIMFKLENQHRNIVKISIEEIKKNYPQWLKDYFESYI